MDQESALSSHDSAATMDEIVPRLWIGDLPSALDVESLKAKKIFSVVTAMRGKVTIHATFNKCQINIDDSADEDVLVHFLPSISFIQKELDKGRGVLVHCQAGLSRSATIVAAYLMYTRKLDPSAALDMIKAVRPNTEPNEGFLQQLEIFHQASYQISRRSKPVRMFYMERTLEEVMNGDGSAPPGDMFAGHPHSPSESPVIIPSRRIRCKMCRQELATREHMLDHGQLGPSTPALPSLTPAGSRRPSNDLLPAAPSRRASVSLNVTISRRPSMSQPHSRKNSSSKGIPDGRTAILAALGGGRSLLESLSMSALETDELEDNAHDSDSGHKPTATGTTPASRRPSGSDLRALRPTPLSMEGIGRDLSLALEESMAVDAPASSGEPRAPSPLADPIPRTASPPPLGTTASHVTNSNGSSSTDLAAQLSSNPKLAALRTAASLTMTGLNGAPRAALSPPILINPKCSGYFVEPMTWMEPMLAGGELAGKIVCPNKKCGAKIGNYDWAGVCCGCKAWVTPGFCIHRSKIDEIVV